MPSLFLLPTQEAGNRASSQKPCQHFLISFCITHSYYLSYPSFFFILPILLPPPPPPPSSIPASCLPYVPEQGTVGASGDLAPLSHLALGMMGEGQMWSPETGWGNAKQVCLNRNVYSLHEGAIVNGTQPVKTHESQGDRDQNPYLVTLSQVLEAHELEPIKLEAKEVR